MRIGDWSSDVCSSDLAVGGKVDPRFGGGPLTLTGTVERLTDGRFVCDGPMWRGIAKSFGPIGVLRVGGVRILVVTNSMQITDVQHFKLARHDPTAQATIGPQATPDLDWNRVGKGNRVSVRLERRCCGTHKIKTHST